MQIAVAVSAGSDCPVVTVSGEIDLTTADEFRAAIDEAVAGQVTRLIVDLRSVRFMDSRGLNVLVGALRRLGQGSLLAVTPPNLRRLFAVAGLDEVIPSFDSVEAAENSLRHGAGSAGLAG